MGVFTVQTSLRLSRALRTSETCVQIGVPKHRRALKVAQNKIMTFISQPLGGKIYIAEPSRKCSQKLLWSVMPEKGVPSIRRLIRELSLGFYPGLLHHRSPTSGLIAHESVEIFGHAALNVCSLVGQTVANVGHVQDFDQLGIKPLHDRLRRSTRGGYAIPQRYVHSGVAEFREGR